MIHRLVFALSLVVFFASNDSVRAVAADEKTPGLEAAARQFVELLVQQQYAQATDRFDGTMSRVMPADKLEKVWKGITRFLGDFKKQGGTRVQKVDQYDIVFVECIFQRLTLETKVVFDQQRKVSGLFFLPARPKAKYQVPTYADQDKFTETEVTIGSQPWQLPGTLTLPVAGGPLPAVVLVHGSGPNDRDETVAANKPFKDLAWGLASRGIAVLRYEKRTRAHQQKMAQLKQDLTVKEETIDDVFAAVETLKKRHPGIDAGRVFMIGHSLGGYLAPRIAALDRERAIAGYVLMAANTRPLEDLILAQTRYLLQLDGSLSDDDRGQLAKIEDQVQRVRELELPADATADDHPFGIAPAYWLDLSSYRPAELAARQDRPLLILQGQRDYQVTLADDFAVWQQALMARAERAERKNVRFKSYADLNHLFISGQGQSHPAEYQQAGHVAEQVIDDMADWILR